MDISIIIINYNTDELTIQAIESVIKYCDNFSFEIIVVDNGSKRTNLKEKLKEYSQVNFFELKSNIGFGRANNFGYLKSRGNYIFLLNSDAFIIDRCTFSIFINYLRKHKDVGCVGANLVTENLEPNICYGNYLSVERVLYNYGLKNVSTEYFEENLATSKYCHFNKPTVVDYLSGAALMIKRDLIDKYGFFNPKYFMYFEDMDLAFRYKQNGFKSVLIPAVRIVHFGGQSRVNNQKIKRKVLKEIEYSKYLFLKNVTTKQFAFLLFSFGKFLNLFRRILSKLK
jgi:hypothetical protein